VAVLKAQFLGMNSDLSPNKVPTGTADIASNIILDGGSLKRREGFSEWEDNVTGSGHSIVAARSVAFSSGYVYVVVKCSNGTLYRREVYPVEATAFTAISGGQTHNGTDAGWFFVWDDYLYYFDRAGGTKWNPHRNSGTAYKAGLPRPTLGPIPVDSAGGEKEGFYHVHVAYRNSRTREEGVVSGTHTPYEETRLSDAKGGITIDNWSNESVAAAKAATPPRIIAGGEINEQDSAYEWDQAIFFCTFGSTEYIGLGSGAEAFSYRAYVDEVKDKTDTSVGLNKSDECLDQRQPITNAGGEPPKSAVGCFTGSQGIYAGLYLSAHATLTTNQAAIEATSRDADLTFEAVATGSGGNSITIRYIAGGTAGQEEVVVATKAITVAIENEVSTARQVLNALHASADASALVKVRLAPGQSGTGVVRLMASADNLSGGGTTGNSQTGGKIKFSIPGFPCMVPDRVTYSTGGDRKIFEPQPWVGESVVPGSGEIVAAAYGAGVAALFMPTSAYAARPSGDGRLQLQEVHASKGCHCQGAAVGTAYGVHAMGDCSWLVLNSQTQDIAENVISSTLSDIPAARRNLTRLAAYSHANQVWASVCGPVSGSTTPPAARRIIVWDEPTQGFWYWDLACFTGSEGVTALCELAYPGTTPTMLACTNAGRILKYGGVDTDDGTSFAAQWRGYFGQERIAADQRVSAMKVHTGTNVASNVYAKLRSLQTGDEDVPQDSCMLTKDNGLEGIKGAFEQINGHLFQVEFSSTAACTSQWVIHDLVMELEPRQSS